MTDKQLAKLVGRTDRTIREWRRKGIDVDNLETLRKYAHEQDTERPNSAYNRELKRRSIEGAGDSQNASPGNSESTVTIPEFDTSNLPDPESDAAADALKSMGHFQKIHAQRHSEAIESGDDFRVKVTGDTLARISQVLLRYDAQIAQARRDAGELLPRQVSEDAIRMACVWLRLTWKAWLSNSLPDVLAQPSPRDAKHYSDVSFLEILKLNLSNALDCKHSLPEWAIEVIKEEFRVA